MTRVPLAMFGHTKITRDTSGYDPANPTSDPTLETACSCCRKCGATVPCETAAAGECAGRCFCGLPDDESKEPSGVETVRAELVIENGGRLQLVVHANANRLEGERRAFDLARAMLNRGKVTP